MTRHLAIPSSTPRDSLMLLFYRDTMGQAIRKRQLQRHYSYPFLLFPEGLRIYIHSFDVNKELSPSQRPFQEVTSGSSVPSSSPNAEGRALELIDYPRAPLKSHRWYNIRLKNKALSPSARKAAADLAARGPLQFNARASKEILLGSKHDWTHSCRLVDGSKRVIVNSLRLPTLGWIINTIIPQAQKSFESIAHEAEGRMGYWLRGQEGERNNCFSKIQLVGQKYRE